MDSVARRIQTLLRGPARSWHAFLPHEFQSWSDMVIQMRNKFQSASYQFDILDDINRRRQGRDESVTEYITDLQNKFRSLPLLIDEATQCHRMKEGLREDIKLQLSPYRFDSVDQMEEYARNVERTIDGNHSGTKTRPPTGKPNYFQDKYRKSKKAFCIDDTQTITPNSKGATVEDTKSRSSSESDTENEIFAIASAIRQTFHQMKDAGQKSKDNRPRPEKPEKPETQSKTATDMSHLCFNCKEFGHKIPACPRTVKEIFCHNCGTPEKKYFECDHQVCIAQRENSKNAKACSQK